MSTVELGIGRVRPDPSGRRGSDFAVLLATVRRAGLLERRPVYYAVRIAVTTVLYVAGWAAFALVRDSWWQLVVGAYLAVVFAQFGFLGHDAGHRQIFRTRRANQWAGLLLGNLGIGLAFEWWVDKHHRHHANPNQEGLDPDIGGADIVYTSGQALSRRGAGRFIARHQGVLFFPMTLLLGLSLHANGFKALLRRGYRNRAVEAVLLAVHMVGYITAVLVVLSPVKALLFVVVQQGLFGLYLGCAFAPNHKGMPILSRDDDSDFLRRQVLTSRNVHGGPLIDAALGGLNYQIEHHLFPSMPRPSLRRAQPIVSAYCAEIGLPYAQTTLLDSYRQAVGYLHTVGRAEPSDPTPSEIGVRDRA